MRSQQNGERGTPTMLFEREQMTGRWVATARTDAGVLVARGETLRESRLALEQLLQIANAEAC